MSSSWFSIALSDLPLALGKGITPADFPDEEFELYSVPSHETGRPEIVAGREIGSNKQLVEPQTVLLSKINPRINRTWVVGPSGARRQIASTEWIAFDRCEVVDPRYLLYFMQQADFRDFLAANASGVGGSLMRVKPATLKGFNFRAPGIGTQKRIVEKLEELLSDLDAGVAELKAAQRKLAQYRQSLLKAAVKGALTADWRAARAQSGELQETGAALLQRILTKRRTRWETRQLAKFAEQGKTPPKDWQDKYPEPVAPDADLPALPDGWTWATADQLSFIVRGASPRPAGDPRFFGGSIPWITVGSLTADEHMFLDRVDLFVTEAGKGASRYIEPDTLLLTNSGATLGVPKITRIGGCINDGSVALLDVDEPTKSYLYWFLRTQTKRLRAMNQGAAQPNLNTDIVRRIVVPICSDREMAEINTVLNQHVLILSDQEYAIAHSLKQSAAQRKNILKAAFGGQLVPQDPNDEPASALLERVRSERATQSAPGKKRGRTTRTSA